MNVRILFILCLLNCFGCSSLTCNEYVEGTSLTLGLYIPMNGTVYGIQAVNYLSGKRIKMCTNENFKVSSNHSITNDSFSVFKMTDNSDVKIGVD